jgi:pimeloyl-ACP methyl ester carboxylesterase
LAKPASGDYSLGAYAAGLRDLLVALGLDRATVIGHSFGGGVAMQFAYQFPELTERLVLVASGGLGREVTLALRAATLPGTALVLRTVTRTTPRWLGRLVHRAPRVLPGLSQAEADEIAESISALADPASRRAFVSSVRREPSRAVPGRRPFPASRPAAAVRQCVLHFLATTAPSAADFEDVRRRLRETSEPSAA